ncbi:MAG: aspartate carbamoyltransferase [Candidatus Magasanikbacteria bacterium]|nr:aspartate carbamoyltransferase [Candidatus Magasanikbacteria bacterium]
MNFKHRDIISVGDLTKEEILHILATATALKKKPQPKLLSGHVLGSCFFEPSTRTRLSFETAMLRLGGGVTGFADPVVTSVKKGETLFDTIKIIGQYVDVIAMRHPLDGAARRATEATDTPVINGGDGANQHPTQTLLDLFTIQECQGRLEGLEIALVGDLKYGRTVHSLAQALAHFGARLYFVAPGALQMPTYVTDELKHAGIKFSCHEAMADVVKKADIIYMTRIQEERFADRMEYERVKDVYVLTPATLADSKKNARVLHPLPRVQEIAPSVDALPQAYYFAQAKNGIYVRQAVLGLVLGKIK